MEYQKANNNRPPKLTPFDQSVNVDELKKAGVRYFVKVAATKENEALFKKYSVAPDTMIVCAPNGDVLTGLNGAQLTQSNVSVMCKKFPALLASWESRKK